VALKNIPLSVINDGDVSPTESTLIHSYPGSMPAYLASRLADRYSSSGDVVFDPFCGAGSVLIESAKLNRSVVGVDLLEISTNISRMPFFLPEPDDLLGDWRAVKVEAMKRVSLFSENRFEIEGVSGSHALLSEWFHGETFAEIIAVYSGVKILPDAKNRLLFRLLLSSALISLSRRISRGVLHWGWIADNVKPKKLDLLKVDVFSELDKRVNRLVDFMKATNGYRLLSNIEHSIFQHNWLSNEDFLGVENDSIDLLLTSPPYPYSIDYTLALRLAHYLFELPFDDTRGNEIGARYKRKRKSRESQYIEELGRALTRASRKVRVGGRAVFVLPHPEEYVSVIGMDADGWLEFIRNSMSGSWSVSEVGYRDCIQRRVVNKNKSNRQELVAAFFRDS